MLSFIRLFWHQWEKALKGRAKYDYNMYSIIKSVCMCAYIIQIDQSEMVSIFKIHKLIYLRKFN